MSQFFEITKDHELTGEWFRPGTSNVKEISGIFRWASGRAYLDLNESLTPISAPIFGDEINIYPVIHGRSTSSKLITIIDAHSVGSSINFGPAGFRQSEKIRSSLAFVGAHVDMDTKYGEIYARIPGLEKWLSPGGINLSFVQKTDSNAPAAIYTIDAIPDEKIAIPAIGAEISFCIERSLPGLTSEIKITTSAAIRIAPNESHGLSWYFDQLSKVCTALALLSGSPMGADYIRAKIAGTETSVDTLVALKQDKFCEFDTHHKFFMLRSHMGVELKDVLSNWFAQYEKFATPSQLALSVLFSRDLWTHVEFLSLMQALEGFHRSVAQGLYLAKEEYDLIEKALVSAIPATAGKNLRESLKSRIRYGNEISLAKRLDDLANRLPSGLRRRIFCGEECVPRAWVDTRNYYTHWDEEARSKVLEVIGVHRACVRLRIFLRIIYLDVMGVPTEAISNALDGTNAESQYLIQLNNMESRRSDPNAPIAPLMTIKLKDANAPDETTGQSDQ